LIALFVLPLTAAAVGVFQFSRIDIQNTVRLKDTVFNSLAPPPPLSASFNDFPL
jgi:hypothetical protein